MSIPINSPNYKYTSDYFGELHTRRQQRPDLDPRRSQRLREVWEEGPAWERHTSDIINAISKKYRKKRVGVKAAKAQERLKHTGGILASEDATRFRAMAARANYLALDRPDIAYATKELCRCFATPSVEAFNALKHLGRYLLGAPRLVWKFFHQKPCSSLRVMVDTDFAGCLSTRRSTSGGVALRGTHLIKHWSATQTYVTLSSAEAELNGICRGASTALGLPTIAQDLGLRWDSTLFTDASAAIGV